MKNVTHYIDVGSYSDSFFTPKARCLFDGRTVEIHGPDRALVEELSRGVVGTRLEVVKPADGLAFLYAVSDAFRTPNLIATEVRSGAPEDALPD